MTRPRLLDLFSGAGGCAAGYVHAGFEVHGVDHRPQPRYLLSGAASFTQADALEFVARHGRDYDCIHASPPCQAYTAMNNRHGSDSPPLIPATLRLLEATGRPWLLENVPGAKAALAGFFVVRLAGEAFGLRVHRARLFASSTLILAPCMPRPQRDPVAVYGRRMDGRRLWTRVDGSEHRAPRSLAEAQGAMGIGWMKWDELREAIPPAYTEFLGRQLRSYLEGQQ